MTDSTVVETLYTLPEMEKTEDGYAYPEKYHNRLFIFKDQYLFFREASYDTFPKQIIDKVVEFELSGLKEDSDLDDLRNDIETLKNELKELNTEYVSLAETKSETPNEEKIKKLIAETIETQLAQMFQNINRVIDNINDKVANKVDLEDLQNWRSQIEKHINSLFSENTQQYPEDSVQSVLERINVLESMNNQSDQSTQAISEEAIIDIVHKELKVVKNGIQEMIDSAVKSNTSNMSYPEYKEDVKCTSVIEKPKLKITTLALLRESGINMSEIAEARDLGLI